MVMGLAVVLAARLVLPE